MPHAEPMRAWERFVVTWESRHLFGDGGRSETTGWDLGAQAGDLLAVLDHYGLEDAHVVGLCGGAVIALAAAAAAGPTRISSLSLWHGDYELGPDCAKTDHQRNLGADGHGDPGALSIPGELSKADEGASDATLQLVSAVISTAGIVDATTLLLRWQVGRRERRGADDSRHELLLEREWIQELSTVILKSAAARHLRRLP